LKRTFTIILFVLFLSLRNTPHEVGPFGAIPFMLLPAIHDAKIRFLRQVPAVNTETTLGFPLIFFEFRKILKLF
jgi:hypothetical protein